MPGPEAAGAYDTGDHQGTSLTFHTYTVQCLLVSHRGCHKDMKRDVAWTKVVLHRLHILCCPVGFVNDGVQPPTTYQSGRKYKDCFVIVLTCQSFLYLRPEWYFCRHNDHTMHLDDTEAHGRYLLYSGGAYVVRTRTHDGPQSQVHTHAFTHPVVLILITMLPRTSLSCDEFFVTRGSTIRISQERDKHQPPTLNKQFLSLLSRTRTKVLYLGTARILRST